MEESLLVRTAWREIGYKGPIAGEAETVRSSSVGQAAISHASHSIMSAYMREIVSNL